ncbi:MAG: helix-turn-helix domain-containing protein [Treponema sp.]|jgi:transcriptional regulator with XRE-family HTH domain|nr:helix-turn-helix domain-containing protein [Treponema sp.]
MYITESGEMLLGIQEAAKEIGVAPATIRNWEKNGIFTAKRAKNGYRIFNNDDMELLRSLLHYSKENRMSVNAANIVFSHDKTSIRRQDRPADGKTGLRPLNSAKWKHCRLARGLGLEDVAKAINISPSYLFKIENERPNVSLDILQRLADFYGENLLYYFDEVENERHLVKKGTGEKIDIGIDGVKISSLVSMNKFSIYMMLYNAAPNSGRNFEKSHHGEETVYVLSGKIHFKLNDTEYVLSAGDSFSFRSKDKHAWFNQEKREARILWVYTPSPPNNASESLDAAEQALRILGANADKCFLPHLI